MEITTCTFRGKDSRSHRRTSSSQDGHSLPQPYRSTHPEDNRSDEDRLDNRDESVPKREILDHFQLS